MLKHSNPSGLVFFCFFFKALLSIVFLFFLLMFGSLIGFVAKIKVFLIVFGVILSFMGVFGIWFLDACLNPAELSVSVASAVTEPFFYKVTSFLLGVVDFFVGLVVGVLCPFASFLESVLPSPFLLLLLVGVSCLLLVVVASFPPPVSTFALVALLIADIIGLVIILIG